MTRNIEDWSICLSNNLQLVSPLLSNNSCSSSSARLILAEWVYVIIGRERKLQFHVSVLVRYTRDWQFWTETHLLHQTLPPHRHHQQQVSIDISPKGQDLFLFYSLFYIYHRSYISTTEFNALSVFYLLSIRRIHHVTTLWEGSAFPP